MKFLSFCLSILLVSINAYASGWGGDPDPRNFYSEYLCKDKEHGIEFYAKTTWGSSNEVPFETIQIDGLGARINLESNNKIRYTFNSYFRLERDFHTSFVSNVELRLINGEVIGFGFFRNYDYQIEFVPTVISGQNFLKLKIISQKSSDVNLLTIPCTLTF